MANGRVCGDMYGSYTCCKWNGCSVIDMLIVQNNLFGLIDYFKYKYDGDAQWLGQAC